MVHTRKGTINLLGQSFKDNTEKNSGKSDVIHLATHSSPKEAFWHSSWNVLANGNVSFTFLPTVLGAASGKSSPLVKITKLMMKIVQKIRSYWKLASRHTGTCADAAAQGKGKGFTETEEDMVLDKHCPQVRPEVSLKG